MKYAYVLYYIQIETPEYSEVLGVYSKKDKAIDELLLRANYRENKYGQLTQYMEPTDEYESLAILRVQVEEQMELVDTDIYRIEKCPLQ